MSTTSNVSTSSLILFCCVLLVYFVPFIVARSRAVNNVPQIFVLNLFLGWTFIGWVIALIWALKPVDKRVATIKTARVETSLCDKGKHSGMPWAKVCSKCGVLL